jgi:ATP-dependent RNA helicase DeaD
LKQTENSGFESLGLAMEIMKGVREAGFILPSPIQEKTIPLILEGRDIMAQAHTGTGKTAAFGLPVMSKLQQGEQLLVLSPTRELAMQVADELYRLGKYAGIRTAAICGGQSYARQKSLIAAGVQVVTATPGRLLDLLSGASISFSPAYIVLDEADEMLDMGFLEDIRSILGYFKDVKQTMLFSATIPKMVEKLAASFLKDPVRIDTKGSQAATNSDINELYFVIEEYERDSSLIRLIDFYDPTKAIIFTRTKKDADRVSTSLLAKGYSAKCLHGDLSQPQREEVIKSFRRGDISLLAATDVAARGLDITDVSHVFNYHLPFDPDSYVHRVGRTGRAGNKGMAVTLVTPQEYRGLARIKKATGADITYRMVPSLTQAHENLVRQLVEKVKNTKQAPLAVSIVDLLEKEMDSKAAALALASLLWAGEEFSGPENLGVTGQKLDRIHSGDDGKAKAQAHKRKKSHVSHNSSWFDRRKSGVLSGKRGRK